MNFAFPTNDHVLFLILSVIPHAFSAHFSLVSSHLGQSVSQAVSPEFDDWSVTLENVLQSEFVQCFSHDWNKMVSGFVFFLICSFNICFDW